MNAWDTEASLPLFERVFRNEFGGATPEQRAYARFGMGESYFIRGIETRPEAIKIYSEFLAPPLSSLEIAPRAILALAVAHSCNAQGKKSAEHMEKIINEYPKSEWREWALIQRAFYSYVNDKPEVGIAWYQRFLREYPGHRWTSQAQWFIDKLEREMKTGTRRP